MYENVSGEVMAEIYFGCRPEDMSNSVILSPVWNLEGFKQSAERVITEFAGWYHGATLAYRGKPLTVISSGIGAPLSGDCALALQYTDCENVLFSGSAGAVNPAYNIGDMIVVNEAVIGEGFSRYHRTSVERDCFGELVQGSEELALKLLGVTGEYRERLGYGLHRGRIFSIDSILGENKETFDFMLSKGCDAVEMEVSAILTACGKAGKKGAALIIISDLPLRYRNLYEGITLEDRRRYNAVKAAMPEMLLEAAIR